MISSCDSLNSSEDAGLEGLRRLRPLSRWLLDDLPMLSLEEKHALKNRISSRRFNSDEFVGKLQSVLRRPFTRMRHRGVAHISP